MKKKICFVVSRPGTAVTFLKDHIACLSEYYDVYLIANIQDASEIEPLQLTGYKAIQIERRPSILKDIKALGELRRYLREMKFDAVQSQASKPSLLMAIAAKQAKIPVRIRIFTGQIWCNMTGLKRLFYKTIDRLTVKLNTHLLADGKPQMEYLIEQKIVKRNKIQVLGNGSICGVDASRFNPMMEVREGVRSELGYSEDNVIYTFLGRLRVEKGIRELFSAFNHLIEMCPNARLILFSRDEDNCASWLKEYPNISDGLFGETGCSYLYSDQRIYNANASATCSF